jgi:hypothetical protein
VPLDQRTSSPYSPPSRTPVFGWLLCEPLSIIGRPKATVYFIFLFFAARFATPKQLYGVPPHTFRRNCVSSMMIPSPLTPTFGWLLRVTSERRPPKAETPSLSLIFDESCFGAPSKRTSRGDREPATGRLLWTHGESRCQDLGAPLPYPWSERAKPLEGRVAAAHLDVVGCGLWVVGHGLWVVGCGLCCGLASAVSYDTHFVDHPDKHSSPHNMPKQ